MESRVIRITDEARLSNAKSALQLIPLDGTYEVCIRKYEKNRSYAQNRLLHMWRKDISDQTGESIKECRFRLCNTHMLPIVLGSEMEKDRDIHTTSFALREAYKSGSKKQSEFVFKQYVSLLSSKDLNVKQFADYLTEIERECTEQGISLRRPEEYHLAM